MKGYIFTININIFSTLEVFLPWERSVISFPLHSSNNPVYEKKILIEEFKTQLIWSLFNSYPWGFPGRLGAGGNPPYLFFRASFWSPDILNFFQ